MTAGERLRRSFVRAGLQPVDRLEALPAQGTVVIAATDWVFDEGLIKALAQRQNGALMTPDGAAVAAHVKVAQAGDAVALLESGRPVEGLMPIALAELAYNSALRKREAPVLERLTGANTRAVEAVLFRASYKGVTDIVTKYAWPLPARAVTRWCALAGITPNQVTFASFVFVLIAFYLFWVGQFALGLVAAYAMTFLDTVDGKLARVTLTSSKIGNVFDHGIDLIHPPFWWWAWFVGLGKLGFALPYGEAMLWVVLGGYVLQRVEEGIFMRAFGMHMHAWRPFDSFFRLITARRNPNLILLTLAVIAGRPDIGFAAVAVWTALCLAVHLVQIIQALAAPRPIVSWLAR
ncbi:MAG: CDP-alcohol phosphatidyltransferase family protein [Alphaproteobacteria bacterium]|nr:CDP-alcohol phosphatidyltransferase family protein [Alphaproteobacteria bacterium]